MAGGTERRRAADHNLLTLTLDGYNPGVDDGEMKVRPVRAGQKMLLRRPQLTEEAEPAEDYKKNCAVVRPASCE